MAKECQTPRHIERQTGLNLLELVVTLVIGGILVATASPTFYELQRALAIDAVTDRLYADLLLARNHAVTHAVRVQMCARDGNQCGNVGHWSEGWLVFEDADNDGTLDDGEKILQEYAGDPTRVRLSFRQDLAYVYYKHTGFGWPNGTFRVCSATDEKPGELVVVATSGRPRFSQPGDAPVDCAD